MDRVEGLLKSLKLSESEKRGRKIIWSGGGKVGTAEPQAMAKLLSDKPVMVDALAGALARVWCPLKGLDCKDLGDNIFLFTFHQQSGKRKALEDGPWEFGKALLVVEDFDPLKIIKEYEFWWILIWVRVFDLPLGMMCREAGEAIGDVIGKVMEVDVGMDGTAVGKFLQIKFCIDIKEPLMRGFMREEDGADKEALGKEKEKKKEEELWCRFEYNFLPDFCYTCGMLDHIDKDCSVKVKKGEGQQFGPWMKAYIPRRGETRTEVFGVGEGRVGVMEDTTQICDRTTWVHTRIGQGAIAIARESQVIVTQQG